MQRPEQARSGFTRGDERHPATPPDRAFSTFNRIKCTNSPWSCFGKTKPISLNSSNGLRK
jgi:hypothetical protein